MRSAGELAAYLNSYFVSEIWRPVGDLLGNISLSAADDFVRTLPLCNGLENSHFDFSRPPSVTLVDPDHIQIAIPGVDRHRIDTTIDISDPLPNADFSAGFAVAIDAQAAAPNVHVDVSSSFNWGGTISDIALAISGQWWALVAKKVIETAITQGLVDPKLTGLLQDRLSGARSYRFDRSHDLLGPAGNPEIVGIFSNGAASHDPAATGYVDILVVADGFVAGDIANFNDLADGADGANRIDGIGRYLTGANETPFHQFASDFRIWKLALVVDDPADQNQRCVVPVRSSDRYTFNFSNLGRIAEIGLLARQTFNRDPIVVFSSQMSPADRVTANVPSDATLRENAQGPFVLLDVAGVSSADKSTKDSAINSAVQVLIHELGHTPLGRYLADEYAANANKTYHGLEPQPRNVSVNPFSGWVKWQPWSGNLLQFLPQDLSNDGAYEFDAGIFRFAPDCRMRETYFGDFCRVCAEELTFGLLARGHAAAGVNGVQGIADLEIAFLRPWSQVTNSHIQGGDVAHLDVFDSPDGTSTRVTLNVAGSSVPDNRQILWDINGVAGRGTYGTLAGDSVTIDALPGTSVQLRIAHDPATGLLGAGRQTPSTSMQLVFDQNRTVTAANLQPPNNLIQSVVVGTVLNPQIDAATGRVSLAQSLWLQARIAGAEGFDVPTTIGFRVQNDGNDALAFTSQPGLRGDDRRWVIDRMLPTGRYTWSAQATWAAIASPMVQAPRGAAGDCFEIGKLPFTNKPRPPMDPFDLQIAETATVPSVPTGLQASSWHPNDRHVKFQFELKLLGEAFDGQNLLETALLDRDRNNPTTVAITGRVSFSLFPRPGHDSDFYVWRVRAVDDEGQASHWVEGRQFAIYLVTQQPVSLGNFIQVIDRLNRAAFEVGGPIDIPRVYFVNAVGLGIKETDYSALKK